MKRLIAIAIAAAGILGAVPLAGAQVKVHKGTGVVTKVETDKMTIKHEPIASINWPAMTMAFDVKHIALLDKVAKDKKVQFEFMQEGKKNVITSIK